MSSECYPITVLPHVSKLYQAYLGMGEQGHDKTAHGEALSTWYGSAPMSGGWMGHAVTAGNDEALADELVTQAQERGADQRIFSNIEKLRGGARAVVTGQQVGLLAGPLLTFAEGGDRSSKSS